MKRLIGLTSAALIFGALIGPSTAMAAGNGAVATPFTAAPYTTGTTTWACSGAHIVQTQANNSFYKDSETCLITGDTTGYVAGTYSSDPNSPYGPNTGILPPYGYITWNSDFTTEFSAAATSWTVTISLNTDGSFTANIEAYYAS